MHRILATVHKIEPVLTPEEAWERGAMSPKDFLAWIQATQGKKVGPTDG